MARTDAGGAGPQALRERLKATTYNGRAAWASHIASAERRAAAVAGPPCEVCGVPMVVGQRGAHYVCRPRQAPEAVDDQLDG